MHACNILNHSKVQLMVLLIIDVSVILFELTHSRLVWHFSEFSTQWLRLIKKMRSLTFRTIDHLSKLITPALVCTLIFFSLNRLL